MKRFFIAVLFLATCNALANQSFDFKNSEKVDALVKARFETKMQSEMLIYFRESANLSAAQLLSTKEARGRWVFETLKRTARSTQSPAISILQNAGATFKVFHIENAIFARGINLKTLNALAQLDSVERIAINAKTKLRTVPIDEETLKKVTPEDVLGHISRINANRVWNELGVKGKGIVIGGQDTGYY